MSEPRLITREQIQAEPSIAWNEYVSLLAHADSHELTDIQRDAHFVFWYESEVQNGGHLQYFENRGVREAELAVRALNRLDVACQARVLAEAAARYAATTRATITSVANYVEVALDGEFEDLDSAFHDCSPSLIEALEKYLKRHESEFVLIAE